MTCPALATSHINILKSSLGLEQSKYEYVCNHIVTIRFKFIACKFDHSSYQKVDFLSEVNQPYQAIIASDLF